MRIRILAKRISIEPASGLMSSCILLCRKINIKKLCKRVSLLFEGSWEGGFLLREGSGTFIAYRGVKAAGGKGPESYPRK